jgi:hypothetical protein
MRSSREILLGQASDEMRPPDPEVGLPKAFAVFSPCFSPLASQELLEKPQVDG